MSNPFTQSLDPNLRGRYVRVVSNDGQVLEGWLERMHHHDRHVVLRDAVDVDRDEELGAAMISHADVIEVLEAPSRIERVALDDVEPAPYHEREITLDGNRQYVDQVRDRGFVGSFPVVRPIHGAFEIVEGHKRIWACRQAGLEAHPMEIVDVDEWAAARRFVADHLPDERHVHEDGSTANGWYGAEPITQAIAGLIDRWGAQALELDRVAFNVDRLDLDVDELSPHELNCDVDGCRYSTNSRRSLSIHQSRAHADEGSEQFWCSKCGDGPSTKIGVKTHNGNKHSGEPEFQKVPPAPDADDQRYCGYCAFGPATERGVRVHHGSTADTENVHGEDADVVDYETLLDRLGVDHDDVDASVEAAQTDDQDTAEGETGGDESPDDVYCGVCGYGPSSDAGVGRHHGLQDDHDGDAEKIGPAKHRERFGDEPSPDDDEAGDDTENPETASITTTCNGEDSASAADKADDQENDVDNAESEPVQEDDEEAADVSEEDAEEPSDQPDVDESDQEDGDREWTFPRDCHCGATLQDSLELAIHRTEEHGVPQASLDHLEPGEFEAIVEDAASIQDIVAELGRSTERVLRMLGLYGLGDVVGATDMELSDITDFEFEGIDAGAGDEHDAAGEQGSDDGPTSPTITVDSASPRAEEGADADDETDEGEPSADELSADEINAAANEHDYLADIADELGVNPQKARSVLVSHGRYTDVSEASRYRGGVSQ